MNSQELNERIEKLEGEVEQTARGNVTLMMLGFAVMGIWEIARQIRDNYAHTITEPPTPMM